MFKSKGVKWIGLGWTGFILENLVLSHNREEIISTFGADKYHLLYNTLSTAACSSIAWGYYKHRKMGPIFKSRNLLSIGLGFAMQTVGLVCLSQLAPKFQMPVMLDSKNNTDEISTTIKPTQPTPSNENSTPVTSAYSLRIRCPMDFKPKDVPTDGIYGLERVSRHAVFWSLGLACAGQACYTLFLPELVMFTFPLVFAAIGTEHQDYRYRRGSGGLLTNQYEAATSNIPFAALIQGKQSWSQLLDETKMLNAGIAVGLATIRLLKVIRR